jgi:hypothetical protein
MTGDLLHKREYYSALAMYEKTGPKWEELTEEQRETIREENRRYWGEMNQLGEMLRK